MSPKTPEQVRKVHFTIRRLAHCGGLNLADAGGAESQEAPSIESRSFFLETPLQLSPISEQAPKFPRPTPQRQGHDSV